MNFKIRIEIELSKKTVKLRCKTLLSKLSLRAYNSLGVGAFLT